MTDDKLPVDPAQGGDRLPARQDPVDQRALAFAHGRGVLSLFEEPSEDEANEFDLRKYWHILLKWRWLVISIAAAVTALALVNTLMTTPMYAAQTLVQIDNKTAELTIAAAGGGQVAPDYSWDDEYLQTQLELLKSRSLAERVATRLNLDQTALDRLEAPSLSSRLLGLIRPRPALTGTAKPGAVPTAQSNAIRDAVAAEVNGGLSATRVENTRLVWIRYDSPSPDFAVRVANAIAEEFIASNQDQNSGRSNFARDYLERQLAETKAKLEASERKLVEYARAQGLTITDDEGRTLALESLTQLSAALAQAQQARIRAQARYRNNATSTEQLTASAIGPLQQQRAVLMAQYQQKLATFKPDYPEMVQLRQQIDEIDKQIAAERGRIGGSVKAEYDAAAAEEAALTEQVERLRTQAFVASSSSIEYNILKRDVDTNRQLYDGLLQRYKELGATSAAEANNIRIIDPADGAGRFKPNVRQDLIRGVLFGLLLGVLAAFLLEYLDDTLKSPHDIEQKLKLAVLGVVPKVKEGRRVAEAAADAHSGFSEAYRSVRAALQFSTDHGVPRTLLVTSPGPGEGKSTAALALARNFARLGKSVLLVEGDLRNPSLHRTLGLKAAATGLSGLLSGSDALTSVIQPSGEDGLQVILAGPLPPNPAELLSGSKLVSMLTVAIERFDQVIIDGPPVLGLADAPILANSADGTVLIIDAGKTKIRTAQIALKRLLAARARVVGALLSRYDAQKSAYGYGYGYNYDYGSGGREGTPKLTRG
ncbi:MAG: polysaccharide biosynthesis tyrosine autokinase [Thermomonas sp.]|uniref:GumC family protein n=1 Tax=Thermomonas sp. TaxID=1971895 RepID=UPI0026204F80|nr:polysaccharide biosynthesis tyrosine autokinase [Thermomonas sp.]MCC7096504.1 polysaccharide biosynthesis tyrosine autokinase [Thermomonas sp.]